MAYLSEFLTAPQGTQKKVAPSETWVDASVGDKLSDGDESRNIYHNDYQIRLYEDAGIEFDNVATVELSDLTGTVKYLNENGIWITATSAGQYAALVVGTAAGGGVSVTCSMKGNHKPKPIP